MSIVTVCGKLFVSSCSCCDVPHTLDYTGEWSQFNMPYFPLVFISQHDTLKEGLLVCKNLSILTGLSWAPL